MVIFQPKKKSGYVGETFLRRQVSQAQAIPQQEVVTQHTGACESSVRTQAISRRQLQHLEDDNAGSEGNEKVLNKPDVREMWKPLQIRLLPGYITTANFYVGRQDFLKCHNLREATTCMGEFSPINKYTWPLKGKFLSIEVRRSWILIMGSID